MKHFIAVDNVCAWPNLTRLPNGDIVAIIFNQPCHGQWEGDVECWASTDGGFLWQRRGMVTQHEPQTNRMNVAAGLAANGDLIALVSGWSNKPTKDKPHASPFRSGILTPWICRSSDGGANWTCEGDLTCAVEGADIPFGDVMPGTDGRLRTTVYRHPRSDVALLCSDDDGHTWDQQALIADDGDHNETDILQVGNNHWIAASRSAGDGHLDLYGSRDGGTTWHPQTMPTGHPAAEQSKNKEASDAYHALTGPMMHPPHLLALRDGRILLTFGIRFRGCYGVGARTSEDNGTTWSRAPRVIVQFGDATDGGYPSSVQRDDGIIVTAWYAGSSTLHSRYHMGVTHWSVDEN